MKKKEHIALLKAEVERLKTNVANANRTFDSKLFEKYRGIEQFGHQLMLANEAIDSKIEEFVKLHSKLMEFKAKEMNENENLFEEKLPEKRNESFDGRFMPNVKFSSIQALRNKLPLTESQRSMNFLSTNRHGDISSGCFDVHIFNGWVEKEVSIYEAYPKLVPDGMVYDPVADKIVKKVCVNQIHQGEFCDCNDSHSFASEVGLTEKQSDLEFILTHMPKYRFTYDQCELVLNTFGRDGFIEALNICQSLNISPDSLCMDKLHGKKSICLTCAKKDDCIYLKAVKHAYISDCAQYASENFTVLKDSDGKEFGVLTEVFDDLIKDGKVISK